MAEPRAGGPAAAVPREAAARKESAARSEAPAAPPPPVPMFSSAGIGVMLCVLILEGVAAFFIARWWYREQQGIPLPADWGGSVVEVDLGTVQARSGGVEGERTWGVAIVLRVNPALKDPARAKQVLEDNKNKIHHMVQDVLSVFGTLPTDPSGIAQLGNEIKDAINADRAFRLEGAGEGIVSEVFFP